MDPTTVTYSVLDGGLPRTRGDGPEPVSISPLMSGAPPHTRGWTCPAADDTGAAYGSPAHAGMDPSATRSPRLRTRLPRTRGDGPRTRLDQAPNYGAPPHTRGWTLLVPVLTVAIGGSPAHAGMDPR